MLVRLQRPDHGLRVSVDALRLEQHPIAAESNLGVSPR
jgi:hypothetical protein